MDRLGGFFGSHEAEEDFDDYVDDSDADLDPPPSPVGQDERRMQVRAYNHWASLLGDLNFPHIDDLEPHTLDDFGPYSVLLDFTDGIDDPAVRFVGAELNAECDYDGPMTRLSEVPSRSVLSRITDHYMQILANQAPIGFEAEFVNEYGTTVLYRGILLPYSSDNATIDYIYGVINWKDMADRKTADELLLELDQALGDIAGHESVETAEEFVTADSFTEQVADDWGDVLELGNAEMVDNQSPNSLPSPAFGKDEDDFEDEASDWEPAVPSAKPSRGVDALGNPIGGFGAQDPAEDDNFDSGMKTAADYGLPDWDDEPAEEDVDDVIDPLADEESSSSLISLVSRGDRLKKSVDLSGAQSAPAMPQAYEAPLPNHDLPAVEGEPEGVSFAENFGDRTDFHQPTDFDTPAPVDDGNDAFRHSEAADDEDGEEIAFAPEYDLPEIADEPGTAEEGYEVASSDEPEATENSFETGAAQDEVESADQRAPEGLYDCLAAAREMAQAAQNTEDRSRKTLYEAVGRAYDFSLEAQDSPEGFDELLSENDLTYQDRAPMTPIVKLVFGSDYDKTRLTEYAAVLMHAHRVGVERGSLSNFLREAEGGLKGVVKAERRARKEEQGKLVEDERSVRSTLAEKLRKMEPLALADLQEDGAEFALVMVRRTAEGELVVLGEIPDDVPLIERAARKLLG